MPLPLLFSEQSPWRCLVQRVVGEAPAWVFCTVTEQHDVEEPPLQTQSPADGIADCMKDEDCTSCSARFKVLRDKFISLSGSALMDETTAQFQALDWLVNEDPAALPEDSTPLSTLQQRYIIASLYFSTSGNSWTTQYNFLSDSSVCEWNDEQTRACSAIPSLAT